MRIFAVAVVMLCSTASFANEAQDKLNTWYELNEICRGELATKEGRIACFKRDQISLRLLELNCIPSDQSDTWTCPK